ncbi:MAG TPA: tetratricopeptide repeat protein [Planctomycetota bacterium]|nr:tetratricopeptide repeat protein [Planctomycetota bacterium]
MRRAAVGLVVVAVLGCQHTWQSLDQYPGAYMRVMDAARAVLARHYVVTNVDRAHGFVEASSIVRANMITKYRTKATARVFQVGPGAYDVEMRVTNELELSEPSLMGRGQPPHDWRAVGFDHLAETALMAEVQAQMMGQTVTAAPRPSYLLFSTPSPVPLGAGELMRPPIPDPVGGAPTPPPAAPAPKPVTAAPRPSRAGLFEQHLAMGALHWERHEVDQALLAYQRAAVAAPSNPVGHLAVAGAWTALRRYSAGAAALREAAAVANGHRLPNTELARLRGPAEELNERLLLLKGWCKQQPSDVDGQLLLAYHYFLAGRADDARASLDGVVRAKPQDPAARFLAQQLGAARS